MTNSVRSVWSRATARTSKAFSSGRIRNDIRLLSSTATLGMALTPSRLCTYLKSTVRKGRSQTVCIDCVRRRSVVLDRTVYLVLHDLGEVLRIEAGAADQRSVDFFFRH